MFHESANPLNCISVGMDVLSYQQLSTDGKNILDLARSKCDAISNSLNDVRYLQVFKTLPTICCFFAL